MKWLASHSKTAGFHSYNRTHTEYVRTLKYTVYFLKVKQYHFSVGKCEVLSRKTVHFHSGLQDPNN